MPSLRENVEMFFSSEDTDNLRANRIALLKFVLLLLATIVAILALVGLLVLWIQFSYKENNKVPDIISETFVQKTVNSLERPPDGKSGLEIRNKLTDGCLHIFNVEEPYMFCQISKCNTNLRQQWELVDSKLRVGSNKIESLTSNKVIRLTPGVKLCLEWEPYWFLIVDTCAKKNDHQRFFLKVNQLDVAQKRVYFTIHSELYPTKCAGSYAQAYGNALLLESCTGTDNQLFYLPEISYVEEFEERYRLLLT